MQLNCLILAMIAAHLTSAAPVASTNAEPLPTSFPKLGPSKRSGIKNTVEETHKWHSSHLTDKRKAELPKAFGSALNPIELSSGKGLYSKNNEAKTAKRQEDGDDAEEESDDLNKREPIAPARSKSNGPVKSDSGCASKSYDRFMRQNIPSAKTAKRQEDGDDAEEESDDLNKREPIAPARSKSNGPVKSDSGCASKSFLWYMGETIPSAKTAKRQEDGDDAEEESDDLNKREADSSNHLIPTSKGKGTAGKHIGQSHSNVRPMSAF